jgi:OLD-like protein
MVLEAATGALRVSCEDAGVDKAQRSHPADVEDAAGGKGAPLVAASYALAAGVDSRAVVLVEGISDQRALEALAERRGRSLDAEGISIVPIGGAQAIGRFLNVFGPQGLDVRLAGLCDAAEEGDFRRGLERAGLGSNLTRGDMELLGFYVCVADLEDELIRALGAASVEQVVDAQGDLGSFRTLQKQPAWQGRTTEAQLRRFMGSGGSRKIRYARLLVDALDLTRVPRPLDLVLAHVWTSAT